MNKLAFALAALAGLAGALPRPNDTLDKIKDSGSDHDGRARVLGALAFTLGDGKYTGFHYDVCQHIIADIQKQLGMAKLDDQVPAGDLAEPDPAGAERHRRPRVRLDHQQRHAPEGRRRSRRRLYVEEVRIAVKASSGIKRIADLNGKTVATTTGTTSVQLLRKNKRAQGMDFKEAERQGPLRQLPAARVGPRRRFRDGRPDPGRPDLEGEEPGRLQDRRRGALGRADRDHVPQGRSGVQEGGRRQRARRWPRAARSPSSTTSGSCSRSRRATPRSACRASDATKAAWANPNDKPVEEYAKK